MNDRPELAAVLVEAAHRLREAGVVPEALGVLEPARRVLGVFPRAERVRRAGNGWRLGALVLASDGALIVGATTTRARTPARVGYASESARERDALRHAASRGGFADGAVVHVGGSRLDAMAGALAEPLADRHGEVVVRWAPGAPLEHAPRLVDYLAEQVGLRLEPPERA